MSSGKAKKTTGTATDDFLPYPIIGNTQNNSLLYPLDAADGTTATITVAGMDHSPITLFWAIKDHEDPAFTPIEWPGSPTGTARIPIPWQWVSLSVGHTVLIYYTAMVAGELKKSHVLELQVQHIREADLHDSLPVVLEATGNPNDRTLDMHTFEGDATLQIQAWPLIQEGQRLYVNVAGDQHKPEYQYSWVAQGYIVNASEAHAGHVFTFKIPRGWMARREDYSALTFHVGVIFAGSEPQPPAPVPDPAYGSHLPENAHEITPRITVRLRVDPTIEPIVESDDFNNYLTQQFLRVGSSIHTRLMRLELPLGSYHGIGLHVVRGAGETVPGMVTGMSLALRCGHSPTEQSQYVFMHLKWKCKRLRFAYSSTQIHRLSATFYNEYDNELHHVAVTAPGWVEFAAAGNEYITKVKLVSSHHGCVDSLTIWHEGDETKEPR
ncbi:hypothetical protein SAMN03159318_01152 [Pseudomonas sp. NFACC42-2]|nr:hypothetical protein SAMN03159318_01152 [Pseudomonas sp. NFACC42-2]